MRSGMNPVIGAQEEKRKWSRQRGYFADVGVFTAFL